VDALQAFASHGVNLTRIESRPVPGSPWHYNFYADYELEQPEKADAALADLARHCSMVKELGRYQAALR
jgi:prephenate dehydratase